MESRQKIEEFKKSFLAEMRKREGVKRVVYFGSTRNSRKWKESKSDLDIKIYGDNLSAETKAFGVLLIEKLNKKLKMGLEKVKCYHPTPIYIDSPVRYELDKHHEDFRMLTEALRSFVKEVNFPTETYQDLWNIVKSWKKNGTILEKML